MQKSKGRQLSPAWTPANPLAVEHRDQRDWGTEVTGSPGKSFRARGPLPAAPATQGKAVPGGSTSLPWAPARLLALKTLLFSLCPQFLRGDDVA